MPLFPARAKGHPFQGKKVIDITNMVESITWTSSTEESGAVTGSVSLKNPGNYLGILVAGSRIIVKQASPFIGAVDVQSLRRRRYIPILDFVVQERDKQVTDAVLELTLGDRLTYLNKGKRDFNFAKKKGRRAPTASFILRKVCTDERIPWNKDSIPTTTIGLPKVSASDTTILAFFAKVLKLHNQLVDKRNGKRPPPVNWDIHMRTGLLTIRPKRPPRTAWYLSETNFVGQPSYRESAKNFATRVIAVGKGTTYHKKKKKDGTPAKSKKAVKSKHKVEVTNDAMAAVYGLITHTEKVSGNVTQDKLRRIANSVLAKKSRMTRELTFTCPGLPDVWPGSKVWLNLPSYGMKGLFAVKSVEFSITGQDGPMMTVTVDAGSIAVIGEAAPYILPVTGVRRPNATTVKVFYKGSDPVVYKHPKGWRIHKTKVVHSKDVAEHERPKKGETVIVTFVNKKSITIPNKVTFPPGLVTVAEEGYQRATGTI